MHSFSPAPVQFRAGLPYNCATLTGPFETLCGGHLHIMDNSETGDGFQCSERFLQVLWNERRFCGELVTVDGRKVDVVAPGTWNVESGPDFRDAALRLDGVLVYGDIEVHRDPLDWCRHGHDRDPAYGKVILHVVWQSPSRRVADMPPCLVISGLLDGPWQRLTEELNAELYPYARRVGPGACALQWALADDNRVVRLLEIAGSIRFEEKVTRMQRAIIATGLGQALYEGLFEALGYKANREPFRCLAQQVRLAYLQSLGDERAREAALFGAAGLLPDPSVTRLAPVWAERLPAIWDQWWRQGLSPLSLSWRRSGMRPLNSPERRLGAGLALLARWDWHPDEWLMRAAAAADSPGTLLRGLDEALDVHTPWSGFRTFAAGLGRPAAVLGQSRRRDIAVNVLLPALCAAARQAGTETLARQAAEAFRAMASLQCNRQVNEAVHRFLVPPSRAHTLLTRACLQQGILTLYRNFCLLLHGNCRICPFTGAGAFAQLSDGY